MKILQTVLRGVWSLNLLSSIDEKDDQIVVFSSENLFLKLQWTPFKVAVDCSFKVAVNCPHRGTGVVSCLTVQYPPEFDQIIVFSSENTADCPQRGSVTLLKPEKGRQVVYNCAFS